MAVVFAVFFIPTAIAWYLLRKEAMPHPALMLLYGGVMVLAAYWVGGMYVMTGDTGEETVGNVFRAYGENGGSSALAIGGLVLGGLAGEYAFDQDSGEPG